MPWPLAVFCWLDNLAHPDDGGEGDLKFVCRVHGVAMSGWCWLRWWF